MTVLPRVLVCLASLVALAVPRTAHAGIGDLIWEMSGPTMLSLFMEVNCDITSLQESPTCRHPFMRPNTRTERRWVTIENRFYFSPRRNEQEVNNQTVIFERWKAVMFASDPMFNFRILPSERIHHGIGGSLNYLFGDDWRLFNGGVKLRPVAVEIARGYQLAVDFRWYPRGFEGDPSRPSHVTKSESHEWVKLTVAVGL